MFLFAEGWRAQPAVGALIMLICVSSVPALFNNEPPNPRRWGGWWWQLAPSRAWSDGLVSGCGRKKTPLPNQAGADQTFGSKSEREHRICGILKNVPFKQNAPNPL